jgi:hypothetical protein
MIPSSVWDHRREAFPSRYDRLARRALGPGRLVRLLAQARSGSLDRALIAGFDPAGSRLLAARALMLSSSRSRVSLAAGLERLLQAAQGPPSLRRVRPRPETVLANAFELRAVAAALRGTSPLYARGVALVDELLSDGTGAAYRGDGDALAHRLREARAAMQGRDATGTRRIPASHRASHGPEQLRLNHPHQPYGGSP